MGDLASAVQFLTRIPTPQTAFDAGSLARAVKYFPLVGGIAGVGAAVLHHFLANHLPRTLAGLFVLVFLVLITGGLHEDGLADAADAFGGGTSREKTLLIMRDSRIGSYGGMALIFSLLGRLLLLVELPLPQVPIYLIAAGVLSRWTVLPLSYFLPPARAQDPPEELGQGARIARQISTGAFTFATVFSFVVVALLLRGRAVPVILGVVLISWLTGLYYKRRIGGTTGDCFGATIQLSEVCIYLCGVWSL